ncbi:MAG: PqqD family protein [Defluviitaleaceae bacterium]|nr:PqqD family protein [Defluviitaleaceae bacterium]
MIFVKNPEIVVQKNEAGFILLDMDSGQFYSLYDVSSYIWECIEQALSQEEIVKKMVVEYEMSEKQAFEDVEKFLNELHAEKIIKKKSHKKG